MKADARIAIRTIRRCIAAGRYELKAHFAQRMDQRGLVWADVMAIMDEPAEVKAAGADDWGRARWIVSGPAADGGALELACVLDQDDGPRGEELAVFITIYWKG